MTVTAAFTQDTYSLTMITLGQGTVTPGNQTYLSGTFVDIAAMNAIGWTFSGWSGDYTGSTNTTITLDSNMTLTATFTQNLYTLTIHTVGQGNVSPGNQTYLSGTSVDLNAMNAKGWTFSQWTGDASGSTNKTITMDSNLTITATFTINTYTLTVTQGSHGTISPETSIVNYGTDKSFSITPDTGYHIVDVLVDSVSVGAVKSCEFADVNTAHSITAVYAIDTFSITVTQSNHGTISPSTATVDYGGVQSFTITPDTGYHIVDVTVDGNSQGAITSYQFSNIEETHTITATFAIDTFTISVTQGANGVISPETTIVNYGCSQAFTITANVGYHIVDVVVDGTSKGAVSAWEFSDVQETHTITASFAIDQFTITVTQTDNGLITPDTTVADYGSSNSFSITPSIGYHIVDLDVDGESKGAVNSWQFTNIQEAHSITATFAIDTFNITVTQNGNGVIAPSTTAINYGSAQSFTITPNIGYHIADVTVDGASKGAVSSWIFSDVKEAHTITASYALNEYTLTINTAGSGSVAKNPIKATYHYGDAVQLTATPNAGWSFATWAGDLTGTDNSGTVTINGDKTVTATFTQDTYTLTITTAGQGTVTPSNTSYLSGTTVDLNAVAALHWKFSGWSGDASGTANTTITMNGNRTVTATFTKTLYTVNFAVSGVGSDYSGSALTVDGTEYLANAFPLTFTWESGSNHSFAYASTLGASSAKRYVWSSTAGLADAQTGSLMIADAGTVTASFNTQYQLTATSAHSSASGSGWYPAGSYATAAVSSSTEMSGSAVRYVFSGWSGAGNSELYTYILMEGPRTVTANWVTQYQVTVSVDPVGSGSATSNTWMSAGTLTLSATPYSNYTFAAWTTTGSISIASSSMNPITATVSGPGTVTANFNSTNLIATVTTNGETYGVGLSGNVTTSQMSNLTITPHEDIATTSVAFTVTGEHGMMGFGNLTLSKNAIPYGTTPLLYIDGILAENQGYTEDANNYYIWYTTHFSTHEITIEFTSAITQPQPLTNAFDVPVYCAVAIIGLVLFGLLLQRKKKSEDNQKSTT